MGSETIRNRQYGADYQTSRKEMTRVLKPFDLQALYIFLCIKVALVTDFACGTGGFITSWLKELDRQVVSTADRAAYGTSIYGIEKKQFPYMLCITNMLLHGLDVPKVYHANSLTHKVLDYTEDDQFDVILMIIWSHKKDLHNVQNETRDLCAA